jgi:hypothetical protein
LLRQRPVGSPSASNLGKSLLDKAKNEKRFMRQTLSLTLQHIIDTRRGLLHGLHRRQAIVRDYVRGVARDYATGLYLFGRPGTAKTQTVRAVLEQEIKEIYTYQRGHLTPMGLFELIAEHPDEVIVLDDLTTIFKSDIALQILLSALEHPAPGDRTRTRVVKYRRKGEEVRACFRGAVICISNRELHDDEVLDAFKSRVNTLNYDPSDAQLGALMLDIAEQGPLGVMPVEALEVAHYTIAEMIRLQCRFDLRLFVNKALASYQQWKDDEAESDWRDLVTATIEEHLVTVRHADERPSRAAHKQDEHALLRDILEKHESREERVRVWIEKTGKSERAYYRRLAEMQ